ncbi:hypothetical protein, partial [Burkholderia sp. LMG 13014]|uniref:hypothetical protein n=1 Tax=Burkholderia sp. LMG 13014 TaxID=2709306 RepID=UPI00196238D4
QVRDLTATVTRAARAAAPARLASTRRPASCAVCDCWFDCPAKYDLALGYHGFLENPVFDHRV